MNKLKMEQIPDFVSLHRDLNPFSLKIYDNIQGVMKDDLFTSTISPFHMIVGAMLRDNILDLTLELMKETKEP